MVLEMEPETMGLDPKTVPVMVQVMEPEHVMVLVQKVTEAVESNKNNNSDAQSEHRLFIKLIKSQRVK